MDGLYTYILSGDSGTSVNQIGLKKLEPRKLELFRDILDPSSILLSLSFRLHLLQITKVMHRTTNNRPPITTMMMITAGCRTLDAESGVEDMSEYVKKIFFRDLV